MPQVTHGQNTTVRSEKNGTARSSIFVRVARCWFRFHGRLFSPKPLNRFEDLEREFTQAMRVRGLAPPTVHGYSFRAHRFLCWYGERHNNLQSVCLRDVDEYLASKRASGWSLGTLAAACRASDPSSSTLEFGVGVLPALPWAFAVLGCPNIGLSPQDRPGRKCDEY